MGSRTSGTTSCKEGKDESRCNSKDGSLFGLEEHAHDVLGFREANLGVREHVVHGSHTHALEQVGSSTSDDGTDWRLQGAGRREAALIALTLKQLDGDCRELLREYGPVLVTGKVPEEKVARSRRPGLLRLESLDSLDENSFFSHVTTGSLVRQCQWFDRERREPGGSGEGLECRSLEPHNMVHPGPNNRSSPSSHQDLIGEHLFAARRSRSAGRHLGWKPGANTSWQLS